MSIELVIAVLMAVVAILVGFAGPAPKGDPVKGLESIGPRVEPERATREA